MASDAPDVERETGGGAPGSLAVVLLSGGLDSYTAAAVAARGGFRLCALSINYGQRHERELAAARAVARRLDVVRHLELTLDLSTIGGSALTDTIDVPKDREIDAGDVPVTYVPARRRRFRAPRQARQTPRTSAPQMYL